LNSNETGFRITWGSVSGATSYKVYRSGSQYSSYDSIASNVSGDSSPSTVPKGVTVTKPTVYGRVYGYEKIGYLVKSWYIYYLYPSYFIHKQ
jgi:hypothetical protein